MAGKKLNPEQLQAIKYTRGPLLVIAGAGTGKTTVITERIKYLISFGAAKPSEILALTFTEKAAKEMQDRVDAALPLGYAQMWISTFHSFGDRILRQEALHIGLDPKYALLGTAETIQFLRTHLFDFDLDYFRPLGNPTKFIAGLVQHFSRLQDEDIAPVDYRRWAGKQRVSRYLQSPDERKLEVGKWKELAGAFQKYEELKTKAGVMDYGDLIVKTLKLFRSRPNILSQYREQFKYILVDEFQDTNIAQNELVKMLAGKNGNVTVVADDDQAIYRWRGAAVSNVVQFRHSFPKTKIVSLTKNYRSAQTILDRAYTLIQHNNPDRLEVMEKIDKKLLSMKKGLSGQVEFLHADRVENEAEAVARQVRKLVGGRKFKYQDIAILVRANNHAEPFVRALGRHGIPHQFLGPGRLFKQPEIVDLIAYLRVLNNFEDSVAFYRVLSMDELKISVRELVTLNNFARKHNLSLFEAAERQSQNETVRKVLAVVEKHFKIVRRETAGQLLYYFLEEMELLPRLLNPGDPQGEKKAANIAKFFDKLKSYETEHEDATVSAVVDWIELAGEVGESPLAADVDWSEVNAVNLLTVHSAKGLEFPVVFLVNLVAQRFPTLERREQIPIPDELVKEILPQGDYHLEEERRLLYVGLTRAKERLYLTAADYYGEGKREKRLSPFISETLGEKLGTKLVVPSKSLLADYEQGQLPVMVGQRLQINYLSYSQIETFKTCPLHYKLGYLLRIPTPPSASQSFGSTIHRVMRDFYEAVLSGRRPTPKMLLDFLSTNWVAEGYRSKAHEKKFFEKAKVYLTGYLKEEFSPKVLPVALEQKFTVPLGRDLKIGGVIDRIDVFPNGTAEIIDYKTGATIPTQKEVDRNLQLTFYALAASSIPEKPFGREVENLKLSLYFFDSQEKISTTRTADDLKKAREEIFKIREEMQKSDFACSHSPLCQSCEYKLFCGVNQ